MQEAGTDRGIAIILWDNVETMGEHQNTVYQQTLAKIAHLFIAPQTTAFYEVCSEIGLPPLGASQP